MACSVLACATPPGARDAARTDDLLIVDCLLPPRVRVLGQRLTYLAARQAVKTSAADCRTRGGEYTEPGQVSQGSALRVWMAAAEQGDPAAQTYVGEIFEKGLGTEPDFRAAALWYRRAADQGYGAAQINLGALYERGLGVERDPGTAQHWYRLASGLQDTPAEFVASEAPAGEAEALREDLTLREHELRQLRAELERLRAELADQESRAVEQARLEGRAGDLEELHRALARERDALTLERQDLEARSKALDESQRRLDDGRLRSEVEREALARQRQQLAARAEGLARRSETLDRREGELEAPLGELREEIARLEASLAERERSERAARAEVVVAGPSIQLIDPPLPLQRGVAVTASVSQAAERMMVGRVEAPAGLLVLNVNDRPIEVAANGIFQVSLAVPQGGLPVAIVAVDQAGRRAERKLQLERSRAEAPALAEPAPPAIEFGRFHALVIGNAAYSKLTTLETAERDAVKVAEVLERRYGFEVELMRNATRYEILSALNRLRGELTENDNLLIFYAGHGELDRANERGHWLPIDADPDNSANWISNVAITDILNAMSARHVMVIADSCYSGSLTRTSLARLEAGMTAEARLAWRRSMVSKRSRTALTSGGLQPVLDRGGGGHSIFARALLDVLASNAEILEAQQLYDELSARVVWAAEGLRFEQTPEYAPIRFSGHESGEFFFVPARLRSEGLGELDSDSARHPVAGQVFVADQGFVVGEDHPALR